MGPLASSPKDAFAGAGMEHLPNPRVQTEGSSLVFWALKGVPDGVIEFGFAQEILLAFSGTKHQKPLCVPVVHVNLRCGACSPLMRSELA
jgi:hypothetical protein